MASPDTRQYSIPACERSRDSPSTREDPFPRTANGTVISAMRPKTVHLSIKSPRKASSSVWTFTVRSLRQTMKKNWGTETTEGTLSCPLVAPQRRVDATGLFHTEEF